MRRRTLSSSPSSGRHNPRAFQGGPKNPAQDFLSAKRQQGRDASAVPAGPIQLFQERAWKIRHIFELRGVARLR